MTDLTSLIARLESAESGSRELDAEIAQAVGYAPSYKRDDGEVFLYAPGDFRPIPAPAFSTSVDCALTLVPDGWIWEVDSDGFAHLWRQKPDDTATGSAKTPALALCIASLKARSRIAEGKSDGA